MARLDATNLLKQVLQNRLGIETSGVHPSDSLASLGVDSLSGLEVLFDVEERLGVQLPSELLSPECTLAELAARLETYLNDTKILAYSK